MKRWGRGEGQLGSRKSQEGADTAERRHKLDRRKKCRARGSEAAG